MDNSSLPFLIIGFASVGYLWNTSFPTNYIKSKLSPIIKIDLINELMTCLPCGTFWIGFIGLLLFSYPISIAFIGGCTSSFLITFLSSFIKYKI